MEILLTQSQKIFFYNGFLLAGLLLFYWHGWHFGRKAMTNKSLWIIALSWMMLALLAGMILGGLSTEHWQMILSGDVRGFKKQGLSLMGGIIAFLIASGLMIRMWRIPGKAIDYLILAVPLASAIGRIGCYLAGCCSGQLCDNNWGVSYGPATHAYQLQVQQGLLNGTEPMSLPVHPFPLYMVMAYLIVYGIARWYSRRQFRPGQLASFTFMIYFISRFILEFWRDGLTNHSMGTLWIGLKTTQWILLALTILFGVIYSILGKSTMQQKRMTPDNITVWKRALPIVVICIAIWPWLGILQQTVMIMCLIPVFTVILDSCVRSSVSIQPRFAWAAFPTVGFFLVTMPQDSIMPPMDHHKKSGWEFKIAQTKFGYTQYLDKARCTEWTSDCNGSTCANYEYEKDQASINITDWQAQLLNHIERKNIAFKFGLTGMAGSMRRSEGIHKILKREDKSYFGLGPYFGLDTKYVGFSGGILAMNNRELGLNDVTYEISNLNALNPPLWHTDIHTIHHFNLRLGKINRLYTEASLNRIGNQISFYPLMSFAAAYGMNDITNRTYVKAGVVKSFPAAFLTHSNYNYSTHTGLTLSAQYPIFDNNAMVGATYLYWNKKSYLSADFTMFLGNTKKKSSE